MQLGKKKQKIGELMWVLTLFVIVGVYQAEGTMDESNIPAVSKALEVRIATAQFCNICLFKILNILFNVILMFGAGFGCCFAGNRGYQWCGGAGRGGRRQCWGESGFFLSPHLSEPRKLYIKNSILFLGFMLRMFEIVG